MNLIQIPTASVGATWPALLPHLSKAFKYEGGNIVEASKKKRIQDEMAQLWAVVDDEAKPKPKVMGALITRLDKQESGELFAIVEILGGEDLKEWVHLRSQIEAWAKAEGCTCVQLWARKGWARHLQDYKIVQYVMRKDLNK